MPATPEAKRLMLGFVLAPLAPGLLVLPASLFLDGGVGGGFWVMKLIALVGYPAMLLLGLPLHMFLQRSGFASARVYVAAGALAGVVAAHVVYSMAPASWITMTCALFGAMCAATFWWIACREPA